MRSIIEIIGGLQMAFGIAIIAFSVIVMCSVLINGLLLLGFGLLLFLDGVRTVRKRALINDIRGTTNSVLVFLLTVGFLFMLCIYITNSFY